MYRCADVSSGNTRTTEKRRGVPRWLWSFETKRRDCRDCMSGVGEVAKGMFA